MLKRLKNIGPGSLVAAAFIGPGTVTICTISGFSYGYALLWALLFSILATIILQEMACRLGVITGNGLGEAIRVQAKNPILKVLFALLIISAIGIGNAAYESGNIGGGVLGLNVLFSTLEITVAGQAYSLWPALIGILASLLLYRGTYKLLEKVLITLVLLMSILFFFTAISSNINLNDMFSGLFVPNQPKDSLLTIMGLIGTTVVPYNLFLHASTAAQRFKNGEQDLPAARFDTVLSIILGGLISIAIVLAAAAAEWPTATEVTSAIDLSAALQPSLGSWSKYFVAAGLFAAGLTSSITAPLAAAYAIGGVLNWKRDLRSKNYRIVWMTIIGIGVLVATMGSKPIVVIRFAQFTNGLLLPIITVFLLYIMNQQSILDKHKNNTLQNVLGIGILLFTIFLGAKSIASVLNLI